VPYLVDGILITVFGVQGTDMDIVRGWNRVCSTLHLQHERGIGGTYSATPLPLCFLLCVDKFMWTGNQLTAVPPCHVGLDGDSTRALLLKVGFGRAVHGKNEVFPNHPLAKF